MRLLLVIPARKGSSYYRKNLQLLNGRSLLSHAIESSKINISHDTLVTSDDPYALEESASLDKIILDERPGNLADDSATLDEVMYYIAITYSDYDTYICLPPTSPLRTSNHVEESLSCLIKDSVISVTEERRSIWQPIEKDIIKPIVSIELNRQKVNPSYIANGAIFISRRELILKNKKKVSGLTSAYVMDQKSSVDIHTPEDLRLAEYYMKQLG